MAPRVAHPDPRLLCFMPDLREAPSGGQQGRDFFRHRESAKSASRPRGEKRRCRPHRAVSSAYALVWSRSKQYLNRWVPRRPLGPNGSPVAPFGLRVDLA